MSRLLRVLLFVAIVEAIAMTAMSWALSAWPPSCVPAPSVAAGCVLAPAGRVCVV